MRHPVVLSCAVMLALIACSGLGEASARSRLYYQTHSEGAYRRHYGYPRPNCTYAIAEYQRRWSSQLWPPSMRCFPYPN